MYLNHRAPVFDPGQWFSSIFENFSSPIFLNIKIL